MREEYNFITEICCGFSIKKNGNMCNSFDIFKRKCNNYSNIIDCPYYKHYLKDKTEEND